MPPQTAPFTRGWGCSVPFCGTALGGWTENEICVGPGGWVLTWLGRELGSRCPGYGLGKWGYRLQAGTFSCFPLNSSASGKMHGPQAPEQCPPKQHQDRSPSHPQGGPGGLHSPTLDRGQQTAKQVGAGVRGQWKSKGESKPSSSEMQILMWLLRTGQWKIKAGTRVKLGSLPTRSLPDLASRLVFFLLLAERNPIRVCVEPPKGKAFGCSWPTWEVGGQRRSCSFWKQIQSLW